MCFEGVRFECVRFEGVRFSRIFWVSKLQFWFDIAGILIIFFFLDPSLILAKGRRIKALNSFNIRGIFRHLHLLNNLVAQLQVDHPATCKCNLKAIRRSNIILLTKRNWKSKVSSCIYLMKLKSEAWNAGTITTIRSAPTSTCLLSWTCTTSTSVSWNWTVISRLFRWLKYNS